jgi:hypothetical protein
MATRPTPSSSEHRRRSKRKASNHWSARIRRVWRDWWIEIVIGVLVVVAIFLLVERMNIRQMLFAWLVRLSARLERLVADLIQGLGGFARRTTLSDLTAYVLLLVVAGLVFWRTRQRLMTHPRFTEPRCPRCGSDLARVHRRWGDRVANLFVPVRRYQCKNQDCRWRGLRVRTSRYD